MSPHTLISLHTFHCESNTCQSGLRNTQMETSNQTVIGSRWNVKLIFGWQQSDPDYNTHTHTDTHAHTHSHRHTSQLSAEVTLLIHLRIQVSQHKNCLGKCTYKYTVPRQIAGFMKQIWAESVERVETECVVSNKYFTQRRRKMSFQI